MQTMAFSGIAIHDFIEPPARSKTYRKPSWVPSDALL